MEGRIDRFMTEGTKFTGILQPDPSLEVNRWLTSFRFGDRYASMPTPLRAVAPVPEHLSPA